MRNLIYSILICCFLISCGEQKDRYETPGDKDFQRAKSFVWDSIANKVSRLSIEPQWFSDSTGFAYKVDSSDNAEYYSVSTSPYKKQTAFDTKRFAKALEEYVEEDISAEELPIQISEWLNKNEFTFYFQNDQFHVDLEDYAIEKQDQNFSEELRITSPDGKYEVFIEDNNLQLKNKTNGNVTALSDDGSETYIYGSAYGWSQTMKGENAEPSPRLKATWSPDGKKILTQISDTRNGEKMYILDWSIDSLYRPELLSYYRPSPGDTTFVKLIPIIYDMETKKMTKIDLKPQPHMLDLGENLYWTKDSKHIYGSYDHRGFKKRDYIAVNPESGKIRTVFTDSSDTNIDYSTIFRYLEEENIALITSEKSGWKQLYQVDWETGKASQITDGEFVVKKIKAIDLNNKEIYFTAAGKEDDINPYYNLLYKMRFDGNELKLLTEEPINHEVFVAPDHNYFVDNLSSPEDPTLTALRSTTDGEILLKIDSADVKQLKDMGWKHPQLFTTTAQDGETEIYGALWKPTNFDESKSYPIIDYTYTGPHMNVFPNTFSDGVYGLYNSAQSLAELGFIVMQVDGMGTAGRSKSFHNKSYKNMGNNLKDHTLAIKALGEKFKWVDTSRVGIFGHSAGGYDAGHALEAFNDTYDVAISESADHDWRMEKAWWPELYAGWLVDSTYNEQSNITMAPKLKGKLLLIHGGIDENVNPSATFKFGEALIEAGKYFDQLIIPSARHTYPQEYVPYVMEKRWNFFVDNLIKSPPDK